MGEGGIKRGEERGGGGIQRGKGERGLKKGKGKEGFKRGREGGD